MTAFGARTAAIPIGGFGTFDGVMLNEFRRPRIEGAFAGEQMRAWDVEWGSAKGTAVIENSYVDVKDVLITRDGRHVARCTWTAASPPASRAATAAKS